MVHGDGQYHQNIFYQLLKNWNKIIVLLYVDQEWLIKNALKGNMPLYKFIGNIFLTKLFNIIYSTNYTDCHTGYWIYNLQYLNKNYLV